MNTTNSGGISPEETQFVLELLRNAKEHGIAEIQYKDLRIRLSKPAQETGSGPVKIHWGTSLNLPKE